MKSPQRELRACFDAGILALMKVAQRFIFERFFTPGVFYFQTFSVQYYGF